MSTITFRGKSGLKTIFLDTQFIIALINQRDQHHARAESLSYLLDQEQFVTTDAILMEIGNSLARGFRQAGIEVLVQLLNSGNIRIMPIDGDLMREGIAFYSRHDDKEWGLVDCLSFIVMRRLGLNEALTHDQHFVQAGFRALLRDPVS